MTVTSDTKVATKLYDAPGRSGSVVTLKPRYDNFIGGHWVPPAKGQYMVDLSPANAQQFCEVARSTAEDVELALDAAHGRRPPGAKPPSPSGPRFSTGSPTPSRPISRCWRSPRPGTTASRCERRWPPTSLSADHFRSTSRAEVRGRGRGLEHRDRQGHRRLPFPRAARRCRPDHSLQLPAAHGRLEARPGVGRRQLHRYQAGIFDTVVDPEAG